MELIKDMIKQFYPLLMMFACVLFVVAVFFAMPMYGEKGLFRGVGKLFSGMELKDYQVVGFDHLINVSTPFCPTVKYRAGVQTVGSILLFKEQFETNLEEEYEIYLLDIKNEEGVSVLDIMTAEEIEMLQEIPMAFIYEKEQDVLYCLQSGVFTVQIKLCGAKGGQMLYEFRLPVEVD